MPGLQCQFKFGLAPDFAVPAQVMLEWVVRTAPARFVAVLELFFRERHGKRKLAPLADEFTGGF